MAEYYDIVLSPSFIIMVLCNVFCMGGSKELSVLIGRTAQFFELQLCFMNCAV